MLLLISNREATFNKRVNRDILAYVSTYAWPSANLAQVYTPAQNARYSGRYELPAGYRQGLF